MNTIYLNIKQAEENRIIVTRNSRLIDFEQEFQGEENKKGNIYKGVVSNVEPSLEAVFVDFGDAKNGLLPMREIPANAPGVSPGGIAVGDKLLVQIKKDNIGDKGAGLTGNISLAGRFLVLRPYGQDGFGVSSAASNSERREMGDILDKLPVPAQMGVIVRSMAFSHSREDIQWDLESYLLPLWNAVKGAHEKAEEPVLIYHENDLLLRVMRDYFRPESGDVVICDDKGRYEELRALVQMLFPDNLEQIRHHDSADNMLPAPIEQKIEQIYAREVSAASGVRVVFDATEALVAVDVNSGRQRQGGNIEETALKTNIEAAEIITEQLRLRNLGGLVVIDFIDMKKRENCEALEQRMAELTRRDRARTRMSKISEFGLMEISRQRTTRSLLFSQTIPCTRCNGSGQVWREHSFALHLLRKVRAAAFHHNTHTIVMHVPREAGVFLLNEKRAELQEVEAVSGCNLVIVPDAHLSAPQYKMKPVKGDKKTAMGVAKQMVRQEEAEEIAYKKPQQVPDAQPVLKTMLPRESMPSKQQQQPAPAPVTSVGGRLFKALSLLFGGGGGAEEDPAARSGRGTAARGGSSSRGSGRGAAAADGGGRQRPQQSRRGAAGGRSSRGGRQRNGGRDGGGRDAGSREAGGGKPRTQRPADADAEVKTNGAPPPRQMPADAAAAAEPAKASPPAGAAESKPAAASDSAPAKVAPQNGGAEGKPATPPRRDGAAPQAPRQNGGAAAEKDSSASAQSPRRENNRDAAPDRAAAPAAPKPAATPAPASTSASEPKSKPTAVPKPAAVPASASASASEPKSKPAAVPKPAAAPAPATKQTSASPSASQAVVLPPIVKKPSVDSAPASAPASTPAASAPASSPAPASTPAASAPASSPAPASTPAASAPASSPAPASTPAASAPAGAGWHTPGGAAPAARPPAQRAEGAAE